MFLITMNDLRENLGWIIGSIVTAVAMTVGWLLESGVVVNVLFLLIGFGITYFVQTRTQKRAWKREYAVRIAEEVYGSLFSRVKWIIPSLEEKGHRRLSFDEWRNIQDDHRYFMVEKKFRKKLDEFYERVENYDRAIYDLREKILPEIANEETERVFKIKTDDNARLEVRYTEKHRNISTTPNIIECLISQTHPKDHALRDTSEISSVECFVNIRQMDKRTFHLHRLEKFNEFWESCLKRMKEDKTYKFIIEENDKLLEEARNVQKEIVKRIEEPWKI